MRLWYLEVKEAIDYDSFDSMVIRAETAQKARELANQHYGQEGSIWTDSFKVSCQCLYEQGEEEIIIGSFNAG